MRGNYRRSRFLPLSRIHQDLPGGADRWNSSAMFGTENQTSCRPGVPIRIGRYLYVGRDMMERWGGNQEHGVSRVPSYYDTQPVWSLDRRRFLNAGCRDRGLLSIDFCTAVWTTDMTHDHTRSRTTHSHSLGRTWGVEEGKPPHWTVW